MHNDEFDSPNAQNEQHKHHQQDKKSYEARQEQLHNRSKSKQKTTAIALSVITCLSICVIGYEVIRENGHKQTSTTEPEIKRPSLVLSKVSVHDHDLLTDEEDDSYDNHQIRLLQDQNRRQANKIKALRQELLEKMQAIHEVKGNLFKQEGDPRDKAKIADLGRQLEERERITKQLATSIKSLETEVSFLQKKIEHAEITRDALAEMIESQRSARENERLAALKEIETLQQKSQTDHHGFNQNLQDREKALALLDAAYREKTEAFEQANKDLAKHHEQLESKTQQHQALSEEYRQTSENTTQIVLNLVAELEWEATAKARIVQGLETQLEQQNLEKSTIVALLEAELQKRNEVISRHEANENLHRNKMGYTANEAQEQLLDLIATLEFEMTRTSFLQQSMDRSIYTQRQKLEDKAIAIQNLEQSVKKHKSILEQKGEELENLLSVLSITREEHHQKVDDLVTALQWEAARATKLEEELVAANEEKSMVIADWNASLEKHQSLKLAHKEMKKKLQDQEALHNNFSSDQTQRFQEILEDLKRNAIAKENQLVEAQDELRALISSEAETNHSLKNQLAALIHQIEAGNIQLFQMQKEVNNLQPHKVASAEQGEKIKELEALLVEKNKEQETREAEIAKREEELLQLVHAEKLANQRLVERIHDFSDEFESSHFHHESKYANLESTHQKTISENAHRIRSLEALILEESQERELRESYLVKQQQELLQLIHAEKLANKELLERIHDFSDEFESTHFQHEERFSQAEQKNLQRIKDFELAVQALNDKLEDKNLKLDQKNTELRALVESQALADEELNHHFNGLREQLGHERSKAESMQTQLEKQYAEHVKELENTIAQLNASLSDKEQTLENQNDQLRHLQESQTENDHKLSDRIADLSHKIADTERLSKETQEKIEQGHRQAVHSLEERIANLNEHLQEKDQQLSLYDQQLFFLAESQKSAEETLSGKMNQIFSDLEDEQNKTHQLQKKLDEKHSELMHQTAQLRDYELHVERLQAQIFDKENELLTAEQKLLLALPQVDMLSAENQHLQNIHGDFEHKMNQMTNVIENQQKQLAALTQQLEEEHKTYQSSQFKNEEKQRTAQQAEKKLQVATLRASLLEDQLNHAQASLQHHEQVIETLQKNQTALKNEHEDQLKSIQASLKSEIDYLKSALADQNDLLENKQNDLQHYESQTGALSQLESELQNEKKKNKEIEDDLKRLISALNNQKNLETEVSSLKRALMAKDDLLKQKEEDKGKQQNAQKAIAELVERLEQERQKNKSIEDDLKKVISAYNADKKRLNELEKNIADRN